MSNWTEAQCGQGVVFFLLLSELQTVVAFPKKCKRPKRSSLHCGNIKHTYNIYIHLEIIILLQLDKT